MSCDCFKRVAAYYRHFQADIGCLGPKGSLGVSRLDGKEDEIRHFLELGVSKTAIAKITGVSRPILYSFMSTRGLRTPA